jgi:hypothetical protein
MPIYSPIHEDEVIVHVTEGGLVAFKGHDRKTNAVIDIFMSRRQARMLLEDLPALIKEAETQAVKFEKWQRKHHA